MSIFRYLIWWIQKGDYYMDAKIEFDMEEIILNIRENKYRFIGSGSGRKVFDINNGYVAKVARNRKGFAQNEIEYKISQVDSSGLFAKVLYTTENYELIIMIKADRVMSFAEVWNYFNVRNNKGLLQVEEIRRCLKEYHLVWQDLCRLDSWGILDGKPLIIDYGFTWEVKKRYYFPF